MVRMTGRKNLEAMYGWQRLAKWQSYSLYGIRTRVCWWYLYLQIWRLCFWSFVACLQQLLYVTRICHLRDIMETQQQRWRAIRVKPQLVYLLFSLCVLAKFKKTHRSSAGENGLFANRAFIPPEWPCAFLTEICWAVGQPRIQLPLTTWARSASSSQAHPANLSGHTCDWWISTAQALFDALCADFSLGILDLGHSYFWQFCPKQTLNSLSFILKVIPLPAQTSFTIENIVFHSKIKLSHHINKAAISRHVDAITRRET